EPERRLRGAALLGTDRWPGCGVCVPLREHRRRGARLPDARAPSLRVGRRPHGRPSRLVAGAARRGGDRHGRAAHIRLGGGAVPRDSLLRRGHPEPERWMAHGGRGRRSRCPPGAAWGLRAAPRGQGAAGGGHPSGRGARALGGGGDGGAHGRHVEDRGATPMTAWAMLGERDGLESVHGGPGPGGLAEGVVDFSVNVNPFGPAPAAAEAWIRADPVSYPDPSSLAAREAAARLWNIDMASVRFSGGATSLLHDVALAWIEPGSVGVVPEPSFAEYARAVMLARGRVVRVPPADHTGSLDIDGTLRAAWDFDARMVFLGRPNTPTGEVVDDDMLAMLVAGLPERCLL